MLLIGFASVLNVLSGIILKTLGASASVAVVVTGLGLALVVNMARFVIWNAAHNRYPLSLTYPLTGLTFPIALVASLWFDEPVGLTQVAAALIIAFGVAIINRSYDKEPSSGR